MSALPPIGPSNVPPSGPTGNTGAPYAVNQAANAAWEAAAACENNPSSVNVQVFIVTVNNLNQALENAGSPNQLMTQLSDYLNKEIDPNGDTLASLCTVPPSQTTIAWLQDTSSTGPTEIHMMYKDLNKNWPTSGSNEDNGNSQLQTDLQNLQDDINSYNGKPAGSTQAAIAALSVALDIQQLQTDLQSINGDGYLTIMSTLLDTSLDSGGDTLSSLAAKITGNDHTDPPSTNLQNFMNALSGTSGTGTVGADLDWMAQWSIAWEYNAGSGAPHM